MLNKRNLFNIGFFFSFFSPTNKRMHIYKMCFLSYMNHRLEISICFVDRSMLK